MSESDLFPAYYVSHEAHYHHLLPHPMRDKEEIMVQSASTSGGCKWEFGIRRHSDIGIRIEMFDDSWDAFVEHPDLFRELQALGQGTNLDEVREVLDRIGFKDITERATTEARA